MANKSKPVPDANAYLKRTQVFAMAVIFLLVGLVIGFLFRGMQSPTVAAQPVTKSASPHAGVAAGHTPTLAEMKHIADSQAAPLLEKLKKDPNNPELLQQVGAFYHASHQFKEAAVFFAKAVQADPKNGAIRTRLASSLYRSGDVDGAIAQLNQALAFDPRDANSLFNLGMIKLEGKQDKKGALAAWQQLLASNPQLSADRRAQVERMISDVQSAKVNPHGSEGAKSND
jgi:cytochrome c-type biogenesis protein CcmH/NrfG